MDRKLFLLLIAAALASSTVLAQSPDAAELVELDTVVVTAVFPAPDLWEISRGDKKVLVMGTLSPAPKRMVWTSAQVEARISQADVILSAPSVSVGADVGLFRGAMLWPAYRRSKKNPDGERLQDVLAPPVYARWLALKQRYLPNDGNVDQLRPLHAATELFDAAVRQHGMTNESLVEPVVKRVARANDIPVWNTTVRLALSDPKATLRQLVAVQLGDEDCLVQTMDRLDTDLATIAVRANAWADGDLAQLRALPFVDQKAACQRALVSNEIAKQQGITDLDARVQARWLEVVGQALEQYDTVFATLPIARLLDEDGVLAAMRAEGYTVKLPE